MFFRKKSVFFKKTLAIWKATWYNSRCYIAKNNNFNIRRAQKGAVEEVSSMAKCSICGKGVVFGHNVSHSNRKTNRTWKPNIRKVKAVVNGTHKTVCVCSSCLRSGKVTRA